MVLGKGNLTCRGGTCQRWNSRGSAVACCRHHQPSCSTFNFGKIKSTVGRTSLFHKRRVGECSSASVLNSAQQFDVFRCSIIWPSSPRAVFYRSNRLQSKSNAMLLPKRSGPISVTHLLCPRPLQPFWGKLLASHRSAKHILLFRPPLRKLVVFLLPRCSPHEMAACYFVRIDKGNPPLILLVAANLSRRISVLRIAFFFRERSFTSRCQTSSYVPRLHAFLCLTPPLLPSDFVALVVFSSFCF